jgi:hypothetical protein
VGSVGVSEVHALSIFRVEMSTLDEWISRQLCPHFYGANIQEENQYQIVYTVPFCEEYFEVFVNFSSADESMSEEIILIYPFSDLQLVLQHSRYMSRSVQPP